MRRSKILWARCEAPGGTGRLRGTAQGHASGSKSLRGATSSCGIAEKAHVSSKPKKLPSGLRCPLFPYLPMIGSSPQRGKTPGRRSPHLRSSEGRQHCAGLQAVAASTEGTRCLIRPRPPQKTLGISRRLCPQASPVLRLTRSRLCRSRRASPPAEASARVAGKVLCERFGACSKPHKPPRRMGAWRKTYTAQIRELTRLLEVSMMALNSCNGWS